MNFDVTSFLSYLVNPYLLSGILVTLALTVVPMILAMIVGTGLAVLQTMGKWPRRGARIYIWLLRGTPLLVLMVMIYSALPQLGIRFSVITCAILALTLNESAYISEIVRAGLMSVPRGQHDAAEALGLSRRYIFLKVIWPQAMRMIVPPIGNSVNGMLKATSLASVISVEELMRRGQVLMAIKFDGLEVYCVVAIYYILLTSIWELIQAPLERRYGRGYSSLSDNVTANFR